jgi:hypothetical protein
MNAHAALRAASAQAGAAGAPVQGRIRRFLSLRDARAHAAVSRGELRVIVPYYPLLVLCFAAGFTVADWLLVYWNIASVGGVATVYLPAWFVVEALFAVAALAAIVWTFATIEYDVYEGVNVAP